MQCSSCGEEIVANAEFCGNCGAKIINSSDATIQAQANANTVQLPMPPQPQITQPPLPDTAQPPQVQPAQTPQNNVSNTATVVMKQESSGLSIAGMVLGILSLLSILLFFIAIPLGIIGFILSIVGIKKGGKAMAIAGIVTSIIGVVGSVLIIVLAVIAANECKKTPYAPECADFNKSSTMLRWANTAFNKPMFILKYPVNQMLFN